MSLTPAIKSSNGVQSPRIFKDECFGDALGTTTIGN
jgi:hypothetical protein